MIEAICEIFEYPFLVRALFAGILISLCAALLGVSLVLRRFSMIGDGLSHVGFGALSVAVATGTAPMIVSAPIVILAAFFLLRIAQNGKVKGDAAIAVISTSALSIGIVAASKSGGMNTDIDSLMFGSILAMNGTDVFVSALLAAVVLVIFILFYHKLFAVTFDDSFSSAAGFGTGGLNMLLAFLTAITVVIGMRMMGTLLISSLIVFPALTSMSVFKSFKKVIISSGIISVLCFFFGLIASYIFEIPTGASVVIANLIVFLIFRISGKISTKLFTNRTV